MPQRRGGPLVDYGPWTPTPHVDRMPPDSMQMRSVVLALMVLICAGGSAAARREPDVPSKRDAALRTMAPGSTRVIIGTRAGTAPRVADDLRRRGRIVGSTHPIIGAITAEVTPADLDALDADPAVTSVSIDAPVAADVDPATIDGLGSCVALQATLGLSSARVTGRGVGVAIIDSGVQPATEFPDVDFFDFTGAEPAAPYDDFGHGTHVAGLVASRGAPPHRLCPGIAPRARLTIMKVLDAQGHGVTSTVIDAIEFATVNKAELGIDVINLSLGHHILEPAATDPLVQAVEAAVRAGIVVVVSAGNVGRNVITGEPGYAGILSPGNAPSAITVGAIDTRSTATRRDDFVTRYSSRGPTWYDATPKPDLVAPGHALVSSAAIGSSLYVQYPQRQI